MVSDGKKDFRPEVFHYLSEKLPSSFLKTTVFQREPFLQCFILPTALHCSNYQVSFVLPCKIDPSAFNTNGLVLPTDWGKWTPTIWKFNHGYFPNFLSSSDYGYWVRVFPILENWKHVLTLTSAQKVYDVLCHIKLLLIIWIYEKHTINLYKKNIH